MKYSYILALAALALSSCNKPITITVENPSSKHYIDEAIAIDAHDIIKDMGTNVEVKDAEHKPVPYQFTSDSMLMILANISPQSTTRYFVFHGKSAQFDTRATGRVYPERKDDLAWENDLVAFRAYGPGLQASGEQGYGYDIFTKRDTKAPILEELYAKDKQNISYHIDHGHGMDCFAVGPTLGAGCTALVINDTIRYPWCYDSCEILDNGPLRFRAKLKFKPVTIDGNTTEEVRDITLDAGRHLNHTLVNYQGLQRPQLMVAGFPLRDDGDYAGNQKEGYFCYINPTLNLFPDSVTDQGRIFQGIVLTTPTDSIRKRTDGDYTHLVAYHTIAPNESFDYYWGYAWDRTGITPREWQAYLKDETQALSNPLKITIE